MKEIVPPSASAQPTPRPMSTGSKRNCWSNGPSCFLEARERGGQEATFGPHPRHPSGGPPGPPRLSVQTDRTMVHERPAAEMEGRVGIVYKSAGRGVAGRIALLNKWTYASSEDAETFGSDSGYAVRHEQDAERRTRGQDLLGYVDANCRRDRESGPPESDGIWRTGEDGRCACGHHYKKRGMRWNRAGRGAARGS